MSHGDALSILPRDGEAAGGPLDGLRVQPHNIEAEQALLGAILINNEAFHRVADFLRPEHFYEPVHRRIFEAITGLINRGQLADPVMLKVMFDEDDDLRDQLGGAQYLGRLARAAETIINAHDYGRLIHDLALRRGLIRLGEDVVNTAYDPRVEEPAREQIETAEQRLFNLAQEGEIEGGFKPFPTVLSSATHMIEAAYRKDGKLTGVPTGLTDLDEKLGGLQPSDLIILAGRPSMGKSALAMTIAANAAGTPADEGAEGAVDGRYAVGVFSLEMSAEQIAMRLLSNEADIGSDELRRGKIGETDWHKVVQASMSLQSRPLFIDDTPALSVAALRTRARRLKRREGLSLIVVDYLQLVHPTNRGGQTSRVTEIAEITQGLKALAKELHVPVLALSQLSRAVEQREDKRPQLSDLRESGAIEQDADVVMFVYRDEYYQERSEPKQRPDESNERFMERYETWQKRYEASKGLADVIIAKQRNGPIGGIRLSFDGSRGRFANAEFRDYANL
jgi:replicative DNA helicase